MKLDNRRKDEDTAVYQNFLWMDVIFYITIGTQFVVVI